MDRKIVLLCLSLVFGSTCLYAGLCDREEVEKRSLYSFISSVDCRWRVDVGLILEQVAISNTDVWLSATLIRNNVDITSNRSVTNPLAPLLSDNNISEVRSVTFNVKPGLRAGIGYFLDHDDIELGVSFEWLNSQGIYKEEVINGSAKLKPIGTTDIFYVTNSVSFIEPTKGDASFSVDYFLLDLLIKKGFIISKNFSCEPFSGIKVSWIFYDTISIFTKDGTEVDSMPPEVSWVNKSKVGFSGAGPMAGININYRLCEGWGMFSISNVSILFGEVKLEAAQGFVEGDEEPLGNRTTDKGTSFCPTLRTTFGLRYDDNLFLEKHHISIRAGFDGRCYFNQYPVVEYVASRQSGLHALANLANIQRNNSFSMMGLILDCTWSF